MKVDYITDPIALFIVVIIVIGIACTEKPISHSWMGAKVDPRSQAIEITCLDGSMPRTERTTRNSFIIGCSQ